MTISNGQAYAIAVIGGAILWQGTALATGRREAWDASMYWTIAYPLGLVLAGVLAYLNPSRPWRWALAMMWIQPVVMAILSGSDFGLLPLGLIMFGFLALPPIGVAAMVASRRPRQEAN